MLGLDGSHRTETNGADGHASTGAEISYSLGNIDPTKIKSYLDGTYEPGPDDHAAARGLERLIRQDKSLLREFGGRVPRFQPASRQLGDEYSLGAAIGAGWGCFVGVYDTGGVEAPGGFNPDGRPHWIAINSQGIKPAHLRVGHELWHSLGQSNSEVTALLGESMFSRFDPASLDGATSAYTNNYGDNAIHEVGANIFSTLVTEPAFWRSRNMEGADAIADALEKLGGTAAYHEANFIRNWPSFVKEAAEVFNRADRDAAAKRGDGSKEITNPPSTEDVRDGGYSFSIAPSNPERDGRPIKPLVIPSGILPGNRADWRKAVRDYIAEKLQGRTLINKDSGRPIHFNSQSRGEAPSKLRKEQAFRTATEIESITEEAVFLGSSQPGKGREADTSHFNYYAIPVEIDGHHSVAWFNARHPSRGNTEIFYEFGLYESEETKRARATQRLGAEQAPPNTSQPGPVQNIGEFLGQIKDTLPAAIKVATDARNDLASHDSSSPTITQLPDGSFRVTDADGNEIGTAKDADGAQRLVDSAVERDADFTPPKDQVVVQERFSKTLEKINDTNNPDYRKAEAIVERIKRQLIPPDMGGKKRKKLVARKMLFSEQPAPTPEERLTVRSKYEIMLTYSAEGVFKHAQIGQRTFSYLPEVPIDGSIFSHNHPGGRGPSDGDLKYALNNPNITIRVVTINESGKLEVFQMKARKKISEEEVKAIASRYKSACDSKSNTPLARREAYELISEMFSDIVDLQRKIQ